MPTLSSARELEITRDKIAYWFFRLNGFFTFENFVVHPDENGSQRTDADIIALRFLYRQELRTSDHPMEDYLLFQKQEKYASVFFVEVKKDECDLNGPWTKRDKRNLQRVLNAIGLVPENNVEAASERLYENYRLNQNNISIRFAMIGKTPSSRRDWRDIPQLTWDKILLWMHSRYVDYEHQKANHKQWDSIGDKLYKTATQQYKDDPESFKRHWLRQAGISDC